MRFVMCLLFFACVFVAASASAAEEVSPEDRAAIRRAAPNHPAITPLRPRRVLIFTGTRGFRHEVIPLGATALQVLGEKCGAYDAVISDDVGWFEPHRITRFDAIILQNSTGELFLPENFDELSPAEQAAARERDERLKRSLLAAVTGGKGLIGIHAATDAFYDWPAFGELIGGYYDGHPWNEEVTIKVEEPEHPLNGMFNQVQFRIADEIYQFNAPYSRDALRVLLSLDTTQTDMTREGIRREDGDFAVSWIRRYGEGRVFYCSLGHRPEIFKNRRILRHYLHGIQYALGDLPADATPSGVLQREALPGRPPRFVRDTENLIPPHVVREINDAAEEIRRITGVSLGVITVDTTGGQSIDDFAEAVCQKWKFGLREATNEDTGVLVVVAVDDRKWTVRIGTQVTGALPLEEVRQVGNAAFVPYFQAGRFGDGIYRGMRMLADKLLAAAQVSWQELFDGRTLRGWQRPETDESGGGWGVTFGNLTGTGPVGAVLTERAFADGELKFAWQVDPLTRAWLHLRGMPAIRLGDTRNHPAGSGGVAHNERHPSLPHVRADLEAGEWNQLRVQLLADHVHVWLNERLVARNVPLEPVGDRTQTPAAGSLGFSVERGQLMVRGIQVRDFLRAEQQTIAAAPEWRRLFNGSDLLGWNDVARNWDVVDGILRNTGTTPLWTVGMYENFALELEFKLEEGTDSGLYFGVVDPAAPRRAGLELQLADTAGADELTPQTCGAIAGCVAPWTHAVRPPGEWNHLVLDVQDNIIMATLNGTPTTFMNRNQWTRAGRNPDGSENPYRMAIKDMPQKGFIGFAGSDAPISIRYVRIQPRD